MKVIVIMGSKADKHWAERIVNLLRQLNIPSLMRIASAHKVPLKVLEIIQEYEAEEVVFITVAGRSNALSGFVDAQTIRPVIACPPYSDKFAGGDIFSSLRMPSGVAPLVVLEPEAAALAAAKILALKNETLAQSIKDFQEKKKALLEEDDQHLLQEQKEIGN
ncbi:MAG: 5-(carboxyamino)imidazole ribonucleotide mutase [Candidatus Aminicenantes bacterium]|nr:AIR carboxylase family protein [Candidatus Aminicenantes bacterium]RLE00426.1 MAG: 5-(carboxyamino)imidazole ribonucleotide mutase [Candidatus Aminicenantes bacterium]RLE03123.1 MAG: 5-(carboxyamino)imidazole ribonucleotide mutase [Candidatus Aminicenantes bacterium]